MSRFGFDIPRIGFTPRDVPTAASTAAVVLVAVLGACARSGPPAPVVDRTGAAPLQAQGREALASGRSNQSEAPAPAQRAAPPPASPAPVANVTAGSPKPRPGTGRVLDVDEARVTVMRGDTLYGIARRHKVPLHALIEANDLRPPYRLRAGTRLRVPGMRVYVVAKGDTVYGLGRRFGISPARIIRANGVEGGEIVPAQKLVIPDDPPVATAAAARPPPEAETAVASGPRIKAIPASVRTDREIPSSPPPRSGTFLWPLQGEILSSYGAKGGGLFNDGINIAANEGDPVRAAENGVVAYAGNELTGYGNLLLISHAGGWVSAYAHNSRLLVKKGQVVRRGEIIAHAGQSGGLKRPQLHFELRRGPKAVDPARYLAKSRSS